MTLLASWGCNEDLQLGATLPPTPALTPASSAPPSPDTRRRHRENAAPEHLPVPTLVHCRFPKLVTCVSAGSRHSTMVTAEGEAFTWGWGMCGQLGHGSFTSEAYPRRVDAFEGCKVATAAAGGTHSAFVLEDGSLHMAGSSEYGELGLGDDLRLSVTKPTRVEMPDGVSVATVRCGGLHTIVLATDGTLWTFGRCFDGQLGIGHQWLREGVGLAGGEGRMGVGVPHRVQGLSGRVIAFACGAFHSAAVVESGELYTWGKGEWGMLGHRTIGDEHWPRVVDPLRHTRVVAVSCGGWHTAAITEAGEVFAFGRGEYGRLGLGDTSSRITPHRVEALREHRISSVSCGGTHTLFVSRDGQVFACGRGEFGRCGTGSSQTLLTPQRTTLRGVLPAGVPASYVAEARVSVTAGGAHSLLMMTLPTEGQQQQQQ